MKTLIMICAVLLSGCANMPTKVCDATYHTGGMDYAVPVYGVADFSGHKMLRAGYPFSFQYVSVDHFKSTTCK